MKKMIIAASVAALVVHFGGYQEQAHTYTAHTLNVEPPAINVTLAPVEPHESTKPIEITDMDDVEVDALLDAGYAGDPTDGGDILYPPENKVEDTPSKHDRVIEEFGCYTGDAPGNLDWENLNGLTDYELPGTIRIRVNECNILGTGGDTQDVQDTLEHERAHAYGDLDHYEGTPETNAAYYPTQVYGIDD